MTPREREVHARLTCSFCLVSLRPPSLLFLCHLPRTTPICNCFVLPAGLRRCLAGCDRQGQGEGRRPLDGRRLRLLVRDDVREGGLL